MTETELPTATLKPQRRWSLAWIVPVIALLAAGWLAYSAWSDRGVIITVQFDHGYGLEAGAAVRYRGIVVGEVRRLELSQTGDAIDATIALHTNAQSLARAGSRFWIVRPRLDLGEVEGLDTIVGARYITALPGDGNSQYTFVGLAEPPVVQWIDPNDLEITLHAPSRMGLRRGAPVLYRGVTVGRVLSVGLTSDGGAVEARAHIDAPYVTLIRQRTKFWAVSGVKANVGIGGLDLEAQSLETVLLGGIALATPADAGEIVTTGHRFEVAAAADDDWLEWEPQVAIGRSELPAGAAIPQTVRMKLIWEQGRIGPLMTTTKSRRGWGLNTEAGLIAPMDLLTPPDKADEGTVFVEAAGARRPASMKPQTLGDHLAVISAIENLPQMPAGALRRPAQPEDVLVIADIATAPLPLAAARFEVADSDLWSVDAAVSVDASWHGATVVARSDGRVIGLLIVSDDDDVQVALLPGELSSN